MYVIDIQIGQLKKLREMKSRRRRQEMKNHIHKKK